MLNHYYYYYHYYYYLAGLYTGESCVGANDYRVKMGSKTKIYPCEYVEKVLLESLKWMRYIYTSNKDDDVTIAVAGVIRQDTDTLLGEGPDLEGYHQKEGV